jgi:hypothetical protein
MITDSIKPPSVFRFLCLQILQGNMCQSKRSCSQGEHRCIYCGDVHHSLSTCPDAYNCLNLPSICVPHNCGPKKCKNPRCRLKHCCFRCLSPNHRSWNCPKNAEAYELQFKQATYKPAVCHPVLQLKL